MIGVPPEITPENAFFWDGMAAGQVLIEQCLACGTFMHPARGICSACQSRVLKHVPLTGPGTIEGFTVNWQRWAPSLDVPYGMADVSFPSYPGVRMLGRLRDVDLETVAVGLMVDVVVGEGPGGTKVPVFTPWPR